MLTLMEVRMKQTHLLQIRPAERRDAERAYVKMVLVEEGKTWTALGQEG